MNLYKLHNKPKELIGYTARMNIPKIAIRALRNLPLSERANSPLLKTFLKDGKSAYLATGVLPGRNKHLEKAMLSDIDFCISPVDDIFRDEYDIVSYAQSNVGKWPALEKIIYKYSGPASIYAVDVQKKPWKKAEPYIYKNYDDAIYYHEEFHSEQRSPAIEKMILSLDETDPDAKHLVWAISYMSDCNMGRWEEFEKKIYTNPLAAATYAGKILGDRWSEAEPYILKDGEAAYYYVRNVLDYNRWSEAEEVILRHPESAFEYARDIIEDRWPEFEKMYSDFITNNNENDESDESDEAYYAYEYREEFNLF